MRLTDNSPCPTRTTFTPNVPRKSVVFRKSNLKMSHLDFNLLEWTCGLKPNDVLRFVILMRACLDVKLQFISIVTKGLFLTYAVGA